MPRTRFQFLCVMAVSLTMVGAAARPLAALADDAAVVKVVEVTEIDNVGNAAVKSTISVPTAVYTALKVNTPNVALLLRKFGIGRGWAVLENVDAKFNDVNNRIEISYAVRAFARNEQGHRWTVPIEKAAALELVDIHDRTAIYQGVVSSSGGPVNAIERVVVPAGSTNLKNNAGVDSFSYEFTPKFTNGDRTEMSFQIENKDSVMGCLAKCYSNERFGALWVAKSRFDNTGDSAFTDYRVRFRIAG